MLYAAGQVRTGMHSMWHNMHAIHTTVREHIASLVYTLSVVAMKVLYCIFQLLKPIYH